MKTYKPWAPLKVGDSVDLIAPAASPTHEAVASASNLLTQWGLVPRLQEATFGEDLLCANSDTQRFACLKEALLNNQSKAIWCLKGGYGCARLIPELLKVMPPEQVKLLIGFSDITVLLLFLQQSWHWQTLHGPGITQLALKRIEQKHIQEVKKIVLGEQTSISFELKSLNQIARQSLTINSVLTGGTLSLIQTSIGTVWQCNTKNKILFLEDINERGYKIDRMLQHLQQAGIFTEVKAVIFGDFIGGQEPAGFSLVESVLQRFAHQCNFPVLHSSEIGHGKFNRPLPFGAAADLQLGENSLLTINLMRT